MKYKDIFALHFITTKMADTCEMCGDNNELWACSGCLDMYCIDCLGEMEIIEPLLPPDPEKWFCTPSCGAKFHWKILHKRAFIIGKFYLHARCSRERRYWSSLVPVLANTARNPNNHPFWNLLFAERRIFLLPLGPSLTEAMTVL